MSKGFVQEVKSLESLPFDLSVEIGESIKPPDFKLTENITLAMYGYITVDETIAIGSITDKDLRERIYKIVLVLLRSRSHRGWNMNHVMSLGERLLMIVFNLYVKENIAGSPQVSDETEKKLSELTGLLSTGDSVVDTQASEDLTPTSSDVAPSV